MDTPPLTPTLEQMQMWKHNLKARKPIHLPITPPPEVNNPNDVLRRSGTLATCLEITQEEEPFVAVIGIGYVGTHLVESFASQYRVIGFDVSERRIAQLREEFDDENHIEFTTCREDLTKATHFLISVPTLLREDKTVDTSYLESAIETVSSHARPGATVVIESSVAVGMTRSLLGPICTSHRFFGGMSPEVSLPHPTPPLARGLYFC